MNYFTTAGITSLSKIDKGSCIHVTGVCGVAMAQIAIALSSLGYNVSGSDIEFYEPMSSVLAASSVKIIQGYAQENIKESLALCIIGNSIRKDNPELIEIERLKIPYTCFPAALYEVVIKDKTSIVISGTHGKTTTTALTAWSLQESMESPSYFIGGAVTGLDKGLSIGSGQISVVEGDEYDSSFFAKVPKFSFYKPDVLVITSVEYDHADIYPDINSINQEFLKLTASMSETGHILISDKGENLSSLTKKIKEQSKAKVLLYGEKSLSDVRILKRESAGKFQKVTFSYNKKEHLLSIPLFGEYNAYNGVASYVAQLLSGVKNIKGFETFPGVKRRQDVLFEDQETILIEDFAHHPTAVRETLKGIKERYPGRKIITAFEPRSNTSRRKIFQNEYEDALLLSDVTFIKEVSVRHNDTLDNLLSISEINNFLKKQGKISQTFSSKDDFLSSLSMVNVSNSVIVLMSNGSFDGIPGACKDFLRSRKNAL